MSQIVYELVQLRAGMFDTGAITSKEGSVLQIAIATIEKAEATCARPGQSIYFVSESSRERDSNPNQRGD